MNQQAKKQLSSAQAVKHLFSSPVGKEVLHKMMLTFHVTKPHQADDPHMSYYFEGQRSVVLWIFKHLKLDVEAMAKLIEQGEDNG